MHKDFNQLFRQRQVISFDFGYENDKPVTHELPATLPFAVAVKLMDFFTNVQDVDDVEGIKEVYEMVRLTLTADVYDRLIELGATQEQVIEIFNWYIQEVQK